jgi:RHS repeat-associated protein
VQGANTTDFVLDGQGVVRTVLNGTVDKTFLHAARGPEYERTGNNAPVWYLYDGLGSVLGTVDGTSTVVHTRKYDVYGAVRASTGGSGPKHKWVGSLGHASEDETGLVYMRARYYDPVVGRFASEDPARSDGNWFAYAGANPGNLVGGSGQKSYWFLDVSEALVRLARGGLSADQISRAFLQHATLLEQQAGALSRRGNMLIAHGEEIKIKALAITDPASRQLFRDAADHLISRGGRAKAESVVLLASAHAFQLVANMIQ